MPEALPDLSRPVAGLSGEAYFAFDRSDEIVVLPTSLQQEADHDGRPAGLLTLLRGAGTPAGTGGRLEFGAVLVADLGAVAAALGRLAIPGRLRIADEVSADVTFTSTLGPIGDKLALGPIAAPFASYGFARLCIDVPPKLAGVLDDMLEADTAALQAEAHLRYAAIAPREARAVTVDPHELAVQLEARLGAAAAIDGGLGEELSLLVEAMPPDLLSSILVAHLLDEQGRLRHPDTVPAGRVQLDLAQPRIVAIERRLRLERIRAQVRRIDLPMLPQGSRRIEVGCNLPESIAGLIALFADLRVPPALPFRPHPVLQSTDLSSPPRRAEAVLALSPGEAINAQIRLRALLQDVAAGALEVTGTWHDFQSDSPLLGPDAFPLPLTMIRATPALHAVATVQVNGTSMTGMQIAVAGERPVDVLLVPRGDGKQIALRFEPRPRIDLDPSMLPGAGAHAVRFTAALSPGDVPLLVEWRATASGEDPVQGRLLTPEAPEMSGTWLAPTPFVPTMVWRVGGGPWSSPVEPALDLVIQVRRAIMKTSNVEGIALTEDADLPGRWRYVPDRPTLEPAQDGRKQFGLIEAGPVAFLQATLRLDLAPARKDTLLSALQRLQPNAASIEAWPLQTESMWIECRQGEAWEKLASGGSSGTPPWNTALAAQPDAAATGRIKAALGGERGNVRLGARFKLRTPAGVTASTWWRQETGDAASRTVIEEATERTVTGREEINEVFCDLVDALSER